ncbi:MAG: hypothetical protein S4CHLAM81_15210 [Chlamydiales bacterium]|nr:hypothetical protein [Chlamydiales bacterium]MCH9636290.1 hypothetical protein [Chlamydiales bacterium]
MAKMRPIRKSCFLILELAVSLFLIALVLFPLLVPNIKLMRAQKNRIERNDNFSTDRLLFCKVKEDFFEGCIPLDQLEEGYVTTNGCTVLEVDRTERSSLQKEGLLVQVQTPYRSHTLYIEGRMNET